MRAALGHLLSAMGAGRLTRQEVLEEIERHLDRGPDRPIEGALEHVLEELYRTPWDPQLLRILARIHELDGDVDGALRALDVARQADGNACRGAVEIDDLGDDEASLDDLLLVARLLLSAGAVEQASDVAERAMEAEPGSLAALNLLSKVRHVQGRLTEMIELWQRIHASSPTREVTILQLEFLYQLSQHEHLVGQPFLPLADGVFTRKHEVQIEVESAFASFRAHDFVEALAICDRVAARRDTLPAELYKLVVFQRAWIQERTGDLEGARATLEKLGQERGLETDLERLMFLARICEQIGSTASTRKALHIHQYVNLHYGKLSVLPRLVALHRHRDEHDAAMRYAREYERRLDQRMQKLTAGQKLRALALAYVPLHRIEVAPLDEDDRTTCELEARLARTLPGRRRREALYAVLAGDDARGEEGLRALADADGPAFKDCAYTADLMRRRGATADATRYYARALTHGGAGSFPVWQEFLATADHDAREALASSLDADALACSRTALSAAARREPSRSDAWAGLALEERAAGRREEYHRYQAKAELLGRIEVGDPWIGRALAAAAYRVGGKPKGVVHEVVASRRRVGIAGTGGVIANEELLGNLGPELRQLIHLLLGVTKDYVRAKWPHLGRDLDDHAYGLRVSKEDERSNGESAALPIAIALLSQLLQRPVPANIALSGALTADAHGRVVVRRVGDAPFKIKGAYHRDLQAIVLPRGNQGEIESATIIPAPTRRRFVRFVGSLDEAVEAVWGAQAWAW